MSGVLVIAETRRGELRDVSLEVVEAARAVKDAAGGPLTVAVIGADAGDFVGALNVEGVDEVVTVAAPLAHFEAHVFERAVAALIAELEPALVLAGHTIDALGWAPALAASQALGFASDVTRVTWEEGQVAVRGAYGDKLQAELEFPGRARVLLLVRAGAFAPASGAGSAATRALAVDLQDAARTEHVEFLDAATGDVDIAQADFLLSIGRGVEQQDDVPQFEQLAEKLGATLAVSRPLVDAGWMSNARQVGQSGKTVKPKVYLALGISGAVQHVAGMQGAETIIAVNSDPEAPIFAVAHYGAVADLFEVAEQLDQHF